MAAVDPAIQAAINKTKAAAGAPAAGTVLDFASGFGQAQAGQQTQSELTIPVWRNKPSVPRGRKGDDRPMGTTASTQMIETDAQTQFGTLLLDKGKMAEWSKIALDAGLISAVDVNDGVKLGRAWDTAVAWAVNIKAATNGATEVTPFEAAKLVSNNTGSALLAQQQYAKDHFTGDKTTTSTTTDNRVNSGSGDVLHQLLGRNPTAGEKASYQHGLNKVAAANPETTTSVNQYKDGVQTGQTNTVSGGYDQRQAQIDQASQDPNVAKEQQATTFYSALINAIGAAV